MKSQQRLASLMRWGSDRPIEGTFDHAVSTPREVFAVYDHERDDVRTALRPIIPFSRLSFATSIHSNLRPSDARRLAALGKPNAGMAQD
jgi:hypothetical protein